MFRIKWEHITFYFFDVKYPFVFYEFYSIWFQYILKLLPNEVNNNTSIDHTPLYDLLFYIMFRVIQSEVCII